MGRLLLIRHGQSVANLQKLFADENSPLTDLGRSQAREAALAIAARFRPSVLVSSPLLRARQTAEVIAGELGLPVEIVPGLQERDFGVLKGQSYEAFRELWNQDPDYDAARPWTFAAGGGESDEQTQRRVIPVLEKLQARYPDDDVLVVCHGVVMFTVLAHLSGDWTTVEIPPNCSVVAVEHTAERWEPPVLICPSP